MIVILDDGADADAVDRCVSCCGLLVPVVCVVCLLLALTTHCCPASCLVCHYSAHSPLSHSLTHSLIHSLTHSLIHSLTHSLTHTHTIHHTLRHTHTQTQSHFTTPPTHSLSRVHIFPPLLPRKQFDVRMGA